MRKNLVMMMMMMTKKGEFPSFPSRDVAYNSSIVHRYYYYSRLEDLNCCCYDLEKMEMKLLLSLFVSRDLWTKIDVDLMKNNDKMWKILEEQNSEADFLDFRRKLWSDRHSIRHRCCCCCYFQHYFEKLHFAWNKFHLLVSCFVAVRKSLDLSKV